MTKKVYKSDLTKVASDLTTRQIEKFFTKTPDDKIYTRPAKGGGTWNYVKGSYVITTLNSLFAYDWTFEIKSKTSVTEAEITGMVIVEGRLTGRVGDKLITKEQFGRAEVKYKKNSKETLDFGNDLKAAATDSLKKCASMFGLFADVYAPDDFYDYEILDEDREKSSSEARLSKLKEVQK